MTPMATVVTRELVLDSLGRMGLEWADEEDAVALVDLLLRKLTPLDAMTWIVWMNVELEGVSPLVLLREGRSREVFAQARKMDEES